MNWQSVLALTGAATLTFVLGACTRTPAPEPSDVDSKREAGETAHTCERYARAAERVIKDWYSEPIEILRDTDTSESTPEAHAATRFAPPWTVKWSCSKRGLSLRARLPEDIVLWAAREGAQTRLDELVHDLRRQGLDPKADRLWIVYEGLDTGDTATFDPRQPYVQHR